MHAAARYVVRAAKRDRFAVSRCTDFEVVGVGPGGWPEPGTHAPYAYEAETDRLWFADTPRSALAQPFLYAAQLDAASEALAVRPAVLLQQLVPVEWRGAAPLFVLSIGRCGSTATVDLLRQAGWLGLSEPDVFDLATWDLDVACTDRALQAAASAWIAFGGAAPERTAFKLRSDLSSHVHVLRRAFPAARYLFLTRAVEPWATSFVRAFGVRNAHLKGTLYHARRCLLHLATSDAPLAVLDYETLADDPNALARALQRLGYDAPETLQANGDHSQANERSRFQSMTDEKRAQVRAFLDARPPDPVPPEARPFVVA